MSFFSVSSDSSELKEVSSDEEWNLDQIETMPVKESESEEGYLTKSSSSIFGSTSFDEIEHKKPILSNVSVLDSLLDSVNFDADLGTNGDDVFPRTTVCSQESSREGLLLEEANIDLSILPSFTQKKTAYGTCYHILSGKIIKPPLVAHCERDHSWCEEARKTFVDSTLQFPVSERKTIQYNAILKPNLPDFILYFLQADSIKKLDTITLQMIICDTLNKRKLCAIFLGVEKDGVVTGVKMSSATRDNIRLALDTSLSTEFDPPLTHFPGLASVDFTEVLNAPEQDTYVAVITIRKKVNQNYKLLSL